MNKYNVTVYSDGIELFAIKVTAERRYFARQKAIAFCREIDLYSIFESISIAITIKG